MAEQPPIPSATASTQKQDESPTSGRGVWVSYKVDTRTRLRSLLRSVARFFRIMSQPSKEPMEEFNGLKEKIGYDHVDGFCTYLSKLYQSSATHTIAKDRWKVTALSIYKSRDSVQHEYLVAEVICAQMMIYLRMERKLHMSGVGQMFKNGSTSQPPNPTAKTQTSDDSDSSPDNAAYRDTTRQIPTHSLSKIASDEISYAKTLFELGTSGHKKLCEVIRFPEGEELSLPQLAVLARCVNSMGRTYHLFEENCYWFTHLMIETAKKIKPNHVEEKLSKKKQGSWNGIVVTKKSTPELIDQAKTLYEEEWAAFLRDIYDTINNPNSEIYKEAERKRLEAERQLAESERQREESERQREEAERLKEEERHKREKVEDENKKLREELAAAKAANGANSSS